MRVSRSTQDLYGLWMDLWSLSDYFWDKQREKDYLEEKVDEYQYEYDDEEDAIESAKYSLEERKEEDKQRLMEELPLIKSRAEEAGLYLLRNKQLNQQQATIAEMLTNESLFKIRKFKKFWNDRKQDIEEVLTGSLPDKSVGQGQMNVGGMTVYNNIGATGEELQKAVDLLKNAADKVKGAGIPAFKKALSGDVYLANEQKFSKSEVGLYYPDNGDIYIHALSPNHRAVHTLVHELAHKWWFEFLRNSEKKEIQKLYRKIKKNARLDWKNMPKGFDFGFKYRGQKSNTKFSHIDERGNVFVYTDDPSDPFYAGKKSTVKKHWDQANKLGFPTQYSKTNLEEFFAELMAEYSMNSLSKELVTEVNRIFNQNKKGSEVMAKEETEITEIKTSTEMEEILEKLSYKQMMKMTVNGTPLEKIIDQLEGNTEDLEEDILDIEGSYENSHLCDMYISSYHYSPKKKEFCVEVFTDECTGGGSYYDNSYGRGEYFESSKEESLGETRNFGVYFSLRLKKLGIEEDPNMRGFVLLAEV